MENCPLSTKALPGVHGVGQDTQVRFASAIGRMEGSLSTAKADGAGD